MIVFVGAVVIGATGAFFSDTETSTGNTFTAGAIDLGVDNESYYNDVFNTGTSWALDWDLSKDENDEPQVRQLFNFLDLKPGDRGEDTISLHVNNNDSYLCADVTLTSNNDNSSTEPELASLDDPNDISNPWDGELASHLKWYWWADDGDNVFETCDYEYPVQGCVEETLLSGSGSAFPNASQTFTSTVDLADANTNVWGDNSTTTNALPGDSVRYIAKAWCFGDSDFEPYAQDGYGYGEDDNEGAGGPDVRKVQCDGSDETNITQTDGMTMDVSFRAVQSRNNAGFECEVPSPVNPT